MSVNGKRVKIGRFPGRLDKVPQRIAAESRHTMPDGFREAAKVGRDRRRPTELRFDIDPAE